MEKNSRIVFSSTRFGVYGERVNRIRIDYYHYYYTTGERKAQQKNVNELHYYRFDSVLCETLFHARKRWR